MSIQAADHRDVPAVVVNQRAFRMRTLRMARVLQRFRNDVIAESDPASGALRTVVARPRGGQVLIDCPRHGTMIDHDVVALWTFCGYLRLPTAFLRLASITHAHPDVLHQDIVRTDVDSGANESNTGRWRCLSGNSHERLGDDQRLHIEIDDTCDFKNDDSWSFGLNGRSQRPRPF